MNSASEFCFEHPTELAFLLPQPLSPLRESQHAELTGVAASSMFAKLEKGDFMRKTLLSIIVVVLLLMSGTTFIAQPGLPPGDYKSTCRFMRTDAVKLYAMCQTARGGWRNTSIKFHNCPGGIINSGGDLRCGIGGNPKSGYPYGAYVGGLPAGNYTRSCQNVRMNGERLEATCQSFGGGWHNTSLNNVSTCRSGIVNDNGNLKCQRW